MKIGFLYSGQGAQYVGMGKDLYEKFPVYAQTIEEASDALGWDMKTLSFEDESKLNTTEFTQPAVLTMSVGLHRLMQEKGLVPEMVSGLSLGEYSALVASETMTFSETVRLVQKRGRWMTEAVPVGVGAMSAIINIPTPIIEQACQEASNIGIVMPANYNMPGQVVISGHLEAVAKVEKLLSGYERSRIIRLNVSGPFHTPLLEPAADKLEVALKEINFKEMAVPVVTNVSGKIIANKEDILPTLVQQVKSPVYWEDCVKTMIANGVDTFIELGPGKSLRGFVKKIDRSVAVENVENIVTLEKTLSKLKM